MLNFFQVSVLQDALKTKEILINLIKLLPNFDVETVDVADGLVSDYSKYSPVMKWKIIIDQLCVV